MGIFPEMKLFVTISFDWQHNNKKLQHWIINNDKEEVLKFSFQKKENPR